jgi:dipeptidyl aminopeptidase/acylaminoacyl peptidase
MDIDAPDSVRMVLQAPDGALWKPVAFGRKGDTLLVQHYASIIDSSIYLLDIEDGRLRRLAGDPQHPSSNIATGFSADGEGVHFITNQREGAAELGWIPLVGDEPIRFVPGDLPWDVTEFEMSPDGKRGAFITNEEGISRLYLFDPGRQRYERVRRTPMGMISGLEFSPDGRRLGMTLSTSQTPNDAFVLPLGRRPLSHGKLERWTFGEVGGLDTDSFVEPELVHFPAPMITDDRILSMPAFYYRPARSRPPYPVIIQVHGGPEGQFRPMFDSTLQLWLDKLGVAVIAPNVRGSLGYGATYLAMDDGRLREHAVADIGALLDWIKAQPELDENRVAVVGASYGGFMALAAAVHYSARLRAVIGRAGISNFVTYLESTQDYRRELRRAEYGDERDPEMRAFLQQISPLNNAHRIDIPVLIAQGKNDPVVPESESLQMVDALRRHGQTVWYMNALNEGHNYLRKENRDLFEQVSFMFLQQYLLDSGG